MNATTPVCTRPRGSVSTRIVSAGSSSSSRCSAVDSDTRALMCRPVPVVWSAPSGLSASHRRCASTRVRSVTCHMASPRRRSRVPALRNKVARDTPSSSARACISSRRPRCTQRAARSTARVPSVEGAAGAAGRIRSSTSVSGAAGRGGWCKRRDDRAHESPSWGTGRGSGVGGRGSGCAHGGSLVTAGAHTWAGGLAALQHFQIALHTSWRPGWQPGLPDELAGGTLSTLRPPTERRREGDPATSIPSTGPTTPSRRDDTGWRG